MLWNNIAALTLGLLVGQSALSETLGTWSFDTRPSATVTLETAATPDSGSATAPKAADGRVMRMLVKIHDKDKKWVSGIQSVSLMALMPQHEHGMLVKPQDSKRLGKDTFAIDGVQFHMQGEWMITIAARYQKSPTSPPEEFKSVFQIKLKP